MRGDPLEIDDVHVVAGTATLVAGVSLTVGPGEVVGLLGPNGSGKSSLLRTVYRVGVPSSGTVLVEGTDVRRVPARWVAQRVGVVLQDMPSDFPLTVREVVTMGRSPHKRPLAADDRSTTPWSPPPWSCWSSPASPDDASPRCPAASGSAHWSRGHWSGARRCW
ncbi:ABC transporter ATP-binding protein [Pseudonocardia sp. ICBG601]|uniref:ABC transporter ATP-binding protein n=1 Tax=Pseudonocardia sp. ICBG601 TaxID=2846759 RepID=UPI0027E24785|nr:ABC transporter ATP-binding protein [Pseudonocardia sp. ICBG601]